MERKPITDPGALDGILNMVRDGYRLTLEDVDVDISYDIGGDTYVKIRAASPKLKEAEHAAYARFRDKCQEKSFEMFDANMDMFDCILPEDIDTIYNELMGGK